MRFIHDLGFKFLVRRKGDDKHDAFYFTSEIEKALLGNEVSCMESYMAFFIYWLKVLHK